MFPADWERLAKESGALKRFREFQSPASLMRTLLLHLACGYSLCETVTIAQESGLATISDVALLKRLRHAEPWFQSLCHRVFQEVAVTVPQACQGLLIRLVDATVVPEPGKTGSHWRIHYRLQVPSLQCDYVVMTATKGQGTGESLTQFPSAPNECTIGDRAYSTVRGIAHVHDHGGMVIIRLNTGSLPLFHRSGQPFDLLMAVRALRTAGAMGEWAIGLHPSSGRLLEGRLCAVRKRESAIAQALKRIRREASRKQRTVKPETLEFATCVLVVTTVPSPILDTAQILAWYRMRWQLELAFKRLKSLAGLGYLPKHDDASARAWLLGKLFVALLTQKLLHYARAISPNEDEQVKTGPRSEWREFSILFHQMQRAIEPPLDLAALCQHWQGISASLAEAPRKRALQLSTRDFS